MSIILEGPNGSGKSTLGRKLSEDLQIPYSHSGPSPDDIFLACRDQYRLLMDGTIVDRVTPISEQVYQKCTARQLNEFKAWRDTFAIHAVYVYCTGEGQFMPKEYYPPGHYEEVVRNRSVIRHEYDNIMETVDHITFNWNTDSYDDFLETLHERLHRLRYPVGDNGLRQG